MKKDKQSALDFANSIQAGFLATVDTNRNEECVQPRVRGVLMWYADESGFYFHTSKTKDLYTQLVNNPFIEVAFFRQEPELSMLRIRGRVDFIEDTSVKEQLFQDRPWLLNYGKERNDDFLGIFRIVNAKGLFWTGEDNMKEREIPEISF